MHSQNFIIFHVPHSSKRIPFSVRHQFVLKNKELKKELVLMTDSYTKELFTFNRKNRLCAKVSRLVVDLERFCDDSLEVMSKVGMGVLYEKTSEGKVLRKKIKEAKRKKLLEKYYHSHHKKFTSLVEKNLKAFGKCLIIDCHSFSSFRQKYEITGKSKRPQICIGTDSFHSDKELENLFVSEFEKAGFEVALNSPFSGSIVPLKFYEKNKNVKSIMIEIRRDLYMDETSGKKLKDYNIFRAKLKTVIYNIERKLSEEKKQNELI